MLQNLEITSPDARSPQEERIEQGRRTIRLEVDEKKKLSKRERVWRRMEVFRDTPIKLNMRRALRLTESMKQTEGQPTVLRWARALAAVLHDHPVHIGDDELIAGAAGSEGRYAVIYPELAGRFISNLDSLHPSKPGDSVMIKEEDIRHIREEIEPYWTGRRYQNAYEQALPDETRELVNKGLILLPTAWARSMLAFAHDYRKVMQRGLGAIRREATDRLAALDPMNTAEYVEQKPFFDAVVLVVDAVIALANRYADRAANMAAGETDPDRKQELTEMAEALRRVPEHPARTFFEAVQCQWFIQVISRLEQSIGGGVSNGRMDQYLYPYYEKDLREGRITEQDALALLESIWLGIANSTELYMLPGKVSFTDGHAHWEALTIGGQTPDGRDATNDLSRLILRSKREFPLAYPDLSARIHSRTPESFLFEIAETIKEGTGFPKLFFDEEIVGLLTAKGAELDEANDYCIVGCTEVKMLNRDTAATGCPYVNLGAILEMTLRNGGLEAFHDTPVGVRTGDPRGFASFDELWEAFRAQVENVMKHTFIQQYVADTVKDKHIAAPFFSMTHDLCMKDGKDMHTGPITDGLYLTFFDVIGFGTVIDSLAAIKKLVFEDGKLTMDRLLLAMDNDFEGDEALRRLCVNAPKYGNNDPFADDIGHDIENLFARLAHEHTSAFGGELDVRYVSITSHVPFGMVVHATPDGRKAGTPLSESVSPSQGMDTNGPTATLTSVARTKAAAYKERAARLLNLKLTPGAVAGRQGTRKLMSLIRTVCDMKMWHLQFNIINKETLLRARENPEKYRDLIVRVAGYSAYFVDLRPELQNEIIRRTEHPL